MTREELAPADIHLSLTPYFFGLQIIKTMTTQEIAARYQELASQRKFIEIQETLYDENVVCQESEKAEQMGFPIFTHGLEAIKAKGVARRATIETVHSYTCSVPVVAADFFSVALKQEVTFKGKPKTTLEEIGVFHVKGDKIIKEQFFY